MVRYSAFRIAGALVLLILVRPSDSGAWGFWSHRQIHQHAVRSLPEGLSPFFIANAETLAAWSVKPDQRRWSDPSESPKHYIDIDRYGSAPFDSLPRIRSEADGRYGRTTVDTNGTVPWVIADLTDSLALAMRRRDGREIIRIASDLGHYIADAHVPLHTTENYDGQLTGQKGLHARWESRLPERFGTGYGLRPQSAVPIADPLQEAFRIILESETLVDSVTSLDLKAREGIPEERLMRKRERRGRTEVEFTAEFYDRYHALLNGMVERRLQAAIGSVASYWTTAWERAGRPDLASVRVRW